jgi:hypothetical protein
MHMTPAFYGVPSRVDSLVEVLFTTRWYGEAQVVKSHSSRGGAGKKRGAKKRAEEQEPGRRRLRWRAKTPRTTKPISIKRTGGRSGGCTSKAVELTSADLRHVTERD